MVIKDVNRGLLGFVLIGRNEGERLIASLQAIHTLCPESPVIYVDSGSTDSSVTEALRLGFGVVELDLSTPFTAARARNAGYRQLLSEHFQINYVQFLDGDCELQPGWVEAAINKLKSDPAIGIVSGRRAEKNVDASIFNKLMDIEWDTPIGEARAVPGDMCVKVGLLRLINGFTENIIAAEDDDFCIRARAAGYKVYRLEDMMSLHDANIMALSQWYRRSKRGGHGYANIHHLHGGAPEYYFRQNLRSTLLWGGLFPATTIASLTINPLLAGILCSGYLLFIVKTIVKLVRKGHPLRVALAYGVLIYTGKIPEFFGVILYWKNRMFTGKHELIEYK
jgi:GT2 family glycosyltransferase